MTVQLCPCPLVLCQGLNVVRTLLGGLRDVVKLLSHGKERRIEMGFMDETTSSSCFGDTLGTIERRVGSVEMLERKVRGELRAGRSQQPDGKKSPGSCFRWNDGILVEALERGDWMLMDAANLCPAR